MHEQPVGSTRVGVLERLFVSAPSRSDWRFAIPSAMAALALLKLWLVYAQEHAALAVAGFDDGLYINLAQHLVNGEWLGQYDHQFTLLKGPGYPLWVAANSFVGLPLQINQHLIYAGACALFVHAIRPCVPSRLVRLGVFAVLLFQPMSFSTSTLRYSRDSLYTTQVLCAVSCVLGLIIRLDAQLKVIVRWSIGLGLVGGFLWITREEGVALLPAVGAAGAMMAIDLWRRRPPDWRRRVSAIALSIPLAIAIVLLVALTNFRHYGIFTISEFKKTEVTDAIGALARVEPQQIWPWVIVTTETRERIYPHSAAFREVQSILDGPRQEVWGSMGPLMFVWDQKEMREEVASGQLLRTICQDAVQWDDAAMRDEIMTGWFVLALREAVVLTGQYKSAPETMGYYARLAGEVNTACAAGALQCGPWRSSLAPPWRKEYLGLTLRRMCRGAARLLTLADMFMLPTVGSEEQLAPFRELTNDRLSPVVGTTPPTPSERSALDQWKLDWLENLHNVYAVAMPSAAVLGTAAFALCVSLGAARGTTCLLGPMVVVLIAIGTRLGLLSYMDVTAFPHALNQLYMLPLYPLVLAFFLMALIDGTHVLRAWRWHVPGLRRFQGG